MRTPKNSIFPRPCARCKVVKNREDFTTYPNGRGGVYFRSFCELCMREVGKIYESRREKTPYKDFTEEQKQARRDATERMRQKNSALGLCMNGCGSASIVNEIRCAPCKEKHRIASNKRRADIWEIVFSHYGKKCVCCGESRSEFLTLDHVGGWGKDHKHEDGRKVAGVALYRWAIKNNFPDTLQTLCYNCNCSQAHSGYCPHERESRNEGLENLFPPDWMNQIGEHLTSSPPLPC